jgi:hypothetical protein
MLTACAFALLGVQSQEPNWSKPIPLFNGKNLNGWHEDSPSHDGKENPDLSFSVRDGLLINRGQPIGTLISNSQYENYRLTVEYRFTEKAGNSGVLIHCSIPRHWSNLIPRCLEVQVMSGNAGDFYMLGESIIQKGKTKRTKSVRTPNFTDDSEKPIGQWNRMVIEAVEDRVKVWVNEDYVNEGFGGSATRGQIGLQSEGVPLEFRKIELQKLASE